MATPFKKEGRFVDGETVLRCHVRDAGMLLLEQATDSHNLGLSVWDASLVLTKFMDLHPAQYGRAKVSGKRVLELGAGCGLAGIYLATLGASVILTDLAPILGLLQKNVNTNMGGLDANLRGDTLVTEFDWCHRPIPEGLVPGSFDMIIAADCVYSSALVEPFARSIEELAGPNTTILVATERRDLDTHALFRESLLEGFQIKKVPAKKLDPEYSFENSEILIMKKKRQRKTR